MNEEELKKLKQNVPQVSKGGDEAFETLQSIEKPKSKKKLIFSLSGVLLGMATVGAVVAIVLSNMNAGSEVMSNKTRMLKAKSTHTSWDYTEKTAGYYNFHDKFQDYAFNLSAEMEDYYYDETINDAISPLSIYMALAMAESSASGDAKQELLDSFGMTSEEVDDYTSILYRISNISSRRDESIVKQKLVNTVWFNPLAKPKEEGMANLADNYFCDSYESSFSTDNKTANEDFSKYVKKETNGLIDKKYDFTEYTMFLLANVLYMKDSWNLYGWELDESNYNFNNIDGTTSKGKLLSGYYFGGKVAEETNYKHFYTSTEEGFTIHFLLPNDGVDLKDICTSENFKKTANYNYEIYNDVDMEKYSTRCYFPEFDASFDEEISEFLKKRCGISTLFDPDLCDFSRLSNLQLYCSQVIHTTKLIVNKKGIEGAAVTVVDIEAGSAAPIYEEIYYDFVIDRPFAYVVTDSNHTPIFTGTVKFGK